MDGPAFLRQFIIQGFVMESAGLTKALGDDEALERYIKRAAVGVWHCSCSCRMGAEDDPMAVTDEAERVRGVEGLRVVDASIFPHRAMRQHQLPNHDGGREDRGRDAAGSIVSHT